MGFAICIVVGMRGDVGVVWLEGRLFVRGICMRLIGMAVSVGGMCDGLIVVVRGILSRE